MRNDKFLTAKFVEISAGIKVEDFITFCIIHDLCQIQKILKNGDYNEGSLEATGLVLTSSKIFPNLNNDFINSGYEEVAQLHSKGAYKEVATSIISFGNNRLKINISRADNNNQILSTYKANSNLSLPATLKAASHPLFDEYAALLYKFSNIIAKADNNISKEEEKKLKEIFQFTHNPIGEQINKSLIITNTNESLEAIMKELNSLIGLEDVKKEIKTLINFIKIQTAREASGLKSSPISYHIVFTGNPGTGKTTVARIIAKIYKALGISSQGQLVETDRSGLIAEYVGQTAIKVNKTVDSALHGVLFIDEAYSITSEQQNDYGKEAIATLIKRMEDDRDKLVVIVAGYTNEMKKFIDTNPGLKSRFNRYIEFADYSPAELFNIYESQCSKLDYSLNDDAKQRLNEIFDKAYSERDTSFGNGRFVRNLFEKTLELQANRIAGITSLNKEILTTIAIDDIPLL